MLGALAEAGLALPPTPPSIDRVELGPANRRRFRAIVEERLAELAAPLVERGALAALPAAGRARLLGRLRAGARDMAAAQLMVELQAGRTGPPTRPDSLGSSRPVGGSRRAGDFLSAPEKSRTGKASPPSDLRERLANPPPYKETLTEAEEDLRAFAKRMDETWESSGAIWLTEKARCSL